jgi:hypothetical protein
MLAITARNARGACLQQEYQLRGGAQNPKLQVQVPAEQLQIWRGGSAIFTEKPPGWHNHVSVVLCCYAFVVAERARRFPPARDDMEDHAAQEWCLGIELLSARLAYARAVRARFGRRRRWNCPKRWTQDKRCSRRDRCRTCPGIARQGSTASSVSAASARTLGVLMHFIRLSSADFAVQRVAMRVALGGHSIPESDVRRRFHRGAKRLEAVFNQKCPSGTSGSVIRRDKACRNSWNPRRALSERSSCSKRRPHRGRVTQLGQRLQN